MLNKISAINITRVLQKIWFSDGISRADIARELGLVKSTVTRIVSLLMERNLVKIVTGGKSGPSGGRKPLHLKINDQYGYILGLEIQTEFFTAVAVNLPGEVLFSHTEPIAINEKSIVYTFFEVMHILNEKREQIPLPLIGIGVGVAGIIDPGRGMILQSNPLNITSPVDFTREVKSLFSLPVLIENDANCCCWGELAFKKTQRHRNFIFVLGEFRKGRTLNSDYWGIAVGLGLVLNGKVYYGSDFSAGEFQSILWEPANDGQFSITNAEAKRIKEDRTILLKVIRELSAHVACLVNVLNLSAVIFGGEISNYKVEISAILEEEIARNWSYPSKVACTIEFTGFKDKAVAYGAAGLFLESLFSIPAIGEFTEQEGASKIDVLLNK